MSTIAISLDFLLTIECLKEGFNVPKSFEYSLPEALCVCQGTALCT